MSGALQKYSRIGFIGLGQMGYPMASNLIKNMKGSEFYINDYLQDTLRLFQSEHPTAKIASTPLEIAQKCSLIITMLPASAQVNSVFFGKDGLSAGIQQNSILIDSSTIDPSTAKEVEKSVKSLGATLLDAPVSGGTPGAKAGTLTFMVGAENTAIFEESKTILKHMGKNITYCGPVGNGQVAKICNNMLLGISMIAASETMNLGVSMGMDPKLLAGIINTSSGRCWSTENYNPCPGVMENVPSSRDYSGGFGVSLMAKDMGLAVNAAKESKCKVTLAQTAHMIYNQVMTTKGFEKKDFSSVFKWLKY